MLPGDPATLRAIQGAEIRLALCLHRRCISRSLPSRAWCITSFPSHWNNTLYRIIQKKDKLYCFSHDLKSDQLYVCSHYIDIHKGNNFNWFLIGGKEKTFLGCTAKCNCTSPSGILLEMKINLRSMRVGSKAEMVKLLSTSSLAERNESKGNFEMIRGKTLRLTCMNVLPWSVYSWKGVECWPVRLLMSSQPELEGDVSLNVNLRDLTWSSSDWRTQHRWEMEPPSFDQDWRLGWRYWHWTGMRGELDWDIYMRTPLLVISGEH